MVSYKVINLLQTITDHIHLIIFIFVFIGRSTPPQENSCKNCEKHCDTISIISLHGTDNLLL